MRKALGALVALATLVVALPSEANMARSSRYKESDVENILAEASARHGLPLSLYRGFGRIESGMNPRKRTGSYMGLFQLSSEEFRKYLPKGDIFDPRDNTEAFSRKTVEQALDFRRRNGRAPKGAELYMQHQQGEGGFQAHASNPDAPAWQNMARTGEGRQRGQRWARKAIWGNMTPEMKRKFGSVDNVKSQDFLDIWADRYRQKAGWKATTEPTSIASPRIPSKARAAVDVADRSQYFEKAKKNLNLNKRETRLYERHLANLYGGGGIDTGMGSRATLLTQTITENGRTYVIPTIWDGKVLGPDQALKRARKEGLARFPAYRSVEAAEKRYRDMHEYMDMDGEQWVNQNATAQASAASPYNAPAPAMSELDTVSAEKARTPLPPPPPTFGVAMGGDVEPDDMPGVPGQPLGVDRSAIMGRENRKKPPASDDKGLDEEKLNDVFGRPFGELFTRPDQGGKLPEAPPLFRDLFRAA
jgi:hypothetical protein